MAKRGSKARVPSVTVDDLIYRVLLAPSNGNPLQKIISQDEILGVCNLAKRTFLDQPSMVEVEPPIKLCGDTHGQYGDVLRLFARGGFPPVVNYLFLGDYVDRGHHNLEVILLFLGYKVKFPSNFFLLRGNHECSTINRVYGFYEECVRRYNVAVWNFFQEVFACMPLTGLVGGKILCMHGGLSDYLESLDQLRSLKRPLDVPEKETLELDLLWSDPDAETKGFTENTRGVSCVFGPDVVKSTLNRLNIDLIVRAHQVVQDGYEFFCNKKLVTIFSAPHYCGQFDNAACMMNIDENLTCSFHVIRAVVVKRK